MYACMSFISFIFLLIEKDPFSNLDPRLLSNFIINNRARLYVCLSVCLISLLLYNTRPVTTETIITVRQKNNNIKYSAGYLARHLKKEHNL